MDSCRGVVFLGDGSYELRDFPMPLPGAGEAVLKVEAVGMCGSDVTQLQGIQHVPGEVSPVVPGHEIIGRVHSLGAGAGFGVEVGQRVAVDLVVRCPRTAENVSGIEAVYGFTLGLDRGHGLWGGYGEYMGILPNTQLLPLRDDIPAAELTLFEPLGSAVNWIERVGVKDGDSVVIQGPGHMGLICAAMARVAGASKIIMTGTSADALRLEAARSIGVDHTIDVEQEDVIAKVAEYTGGMMADVVMDLAADTPVTVQLCIALTTFEGRILLAGLKNEAPIELVTDYIVLKGLTVVGGAGSTPSSMRRAAALLNGGKIPTQQLLGEVLTLDQLDEAMALLQRKADRDAIRVSLRHD